MTQIRVSRLKPDEIEEALVLARLSTPGLAPEAWREAAAAILAEPETGGVLLARCEAGRACGLLHYSLSRDLEGRGCLEVGALVAFDLTRPHRVAEALVSEAVQRGRRQGCDRLKLVQPLEDPTGANALILASSLAHLHSVF